MKRTALEEFLETMARAAPLRRKALKGLNRTDAEEVLAATLLWCWDNRAAFDQHKCTLSQWFYERMRNERATLRRHGRPYAVPAHTAADNSTEGEAYVYTFTEALQRLNELQRRALEREIARDTPRRKLPSSVAHIKAQLEERSFDAVQKAATQEHAPTAKKIESDRDQRDKRGIDHEIERMLRGPRVGTKECPPCVHCLWYYGYTAGAPRPFGRDPEVNAAMAAVDERKREIAQRMMRP